MVLRIVMVLGEVVEVIGDDKKNFLLNFCFAHIGSFKFLCLPLIIHP